MRLPGLTVRIVPGPGPAEGDVRYGDRLWLASQPRALLENLQRTRRGDGADRLLSRGAIEDRIERMLRISGEKALNQLRDTAQKIAPALELTTELGKLQEIVGKLLGSREGTLTGSAASARLAGLSQKLAAAFSLANNWSSSSLRSGSPAEARSMKALRSESGYSSASRNSALTRVHRSSWPGLASAL